MAGKLDYMTNEFLTEIVDRLGKEYGFDSAIGEFYKFKDLKVSWMRSYKWISFKVSDYIKYAPEDVVEDFIRTVFIKLTQPDVNIMYGELFLNWCDSKEFLRDVKEIYLCRIKRVAETPVGAVHNLNDSIDRLVARGLISKMNVPTMLWKKKLSSSDPDLSRKSKIFKVIVMNNRLDKKDISTETLDAAVFRSIVELDATSFTEAGIDTKYCERRFSEFENFDKHNNIIDTIIW